MTIYFIQVTKYVYIQDEMKCIISITYSVWILFEIILNIYTYSSNLPLKIITAHFYNVQILLSNRKHKTRQLWNYNFGIIYDENDVALTYTRPGATLRIIKRRPVGSGSRLDIDIILAIVLVLEEYGQMLFGVQIPNHTKSHSGRFRFNE